MKIKSIKTISSKSLRYDIEVQDNHNFFANNVLVHNCSATYVWDRGQFKVCGRNVVVTDENTHYWRIAKKYNFKEILKKNKHLAIQGEIVGPGVGNGSGKNLYGNKENEFYVFNIVNTKTRQLLSFDDIKHFCKKYNLKLVPILDDNIIINSALNKAYDYDIEKWVKYSKGKSVLADVNREGIVVREITNKKINIPNLGDKLSFKVINPDFLIEHKQ